MRVSAAILLCAACVLSAAASSPASADGAPVTVARPVVTGVAQDGQTLTTSDGEWTGTPPIIFSYQWRRCDPTGATCADIAGATAPSYTLAPADVGSTIRARVFATNDAGTDYRSSSATEVVAASGSDACGTTSLFPGSVTHVVWIWMENETYSSVIGNTSAAPYLNQLAGQCGLATNYA